MMPRPGCESVWAELSLVAVPGSPCARPGGKLIDLGESPGLTGKINRAPSKAYHGKLLWCKLTKKPEARVAVD